MPRFGPIKRKELIRYLQELGFEGPFNGTRHQFMQKGEMTVRIPNPHEGDIGRELLSRILRQARIDKKTWEQL